MLVVALSMVVDVRKEEDVSLVIQCKYVLLVDSRKMALRVQNEHITNLVMERFWPSNGPLASYVSLGWIWRSDNDYLKKVFMNK